MRSKSLVILLTLSLFAMSFSTCKQNNDSSECRNNHTEGSLIDSAKGADGQKTDTGTKKNEDTPPNKSEGDESKSSQNTNPEGEDKDERIYEILIVLIVLVLLFGGGCVYYRKKCKTHKKTEGGGRPKSPPNIKSSIETNQDISSNRPINNPQEDILPPMQAPENTDTEGGDDSNISNNTWIVVGASVKGNGHIECDMSCQDNHKFESIGNGWGVAVVSDGAGSATHSELGSKVVCERGIYHFKNLIDEQGWLKNNTLPTDMEWWQKSYDVLKTIRNEVAMVAKKNNVEVKSLSATCLVVIYSPWGLLAVHVGDGRMGYKSASGEWKAMMTPHKGDEANQTIFLVSDFWSIPNFVLSGVLVPECVVVREPVKAFALMSDGCENTAWRCTTQNPETGKYYDQNKPFEGFFNPLEETLASFHKDNVSEEERNEKWYKFIESGTKGFVKEQDDKTMILGVFL